MKFLVTWEVWYFDDDVKYYTSNYEEAENLNKLIEYLDTGKEKDFFSPELKVTFHEGDFNIEYVLVESEAGERLWKDPDYEPDDDPEISSEDVKRIDDKAEFIEVVKSDYLLLEYGRDIFRADKEIVLAAVKQDRRALEYADKKLKADKEVVLAATEDKDDIGF